MSQTHLAVLDAVRRVGGSVWAVTVRDIEFQLDFPLIDPKVGDEIEISRSTLVFSVLHKGVVLHSESRVQEGSPVYCWVSCPEHKVQEGQTGIFVESAHTTWEDSQGDVHTGVPLFVIRLDDGRVVPFRILDADLYWRAIPPESSIDLIMQDWDRDL